MKWEDIKIGMLIRLIDNPANFYIGCNIGDIFKVKRMMDAPDWYIIEGVNNDGVKGLGKDYLKFWDYCNRNLMDLKI